MSPRVSPHVVAAHAAAAAIAIASAGAAVAAEGGRIAPTISVAETPLATVAVGTELTATHRDAPLVALAVAVANHRLERLTLAREAFVLRDASGQSYAPAGVAAVRRAGISISADRRRAQPFFEAMALRHAASRRVGAVFYPSLAPGPGFGHGVRADRVALPRGTFATAVIYFPRPASAGPWTLEVTIPELLRPIAVRFVPL